MSQPTAGDQQEASRVASSTRRETKPVCRFFGSRSGCRAGENCRYAHELPAQGVQPARRNSGSKPTKKSLKEGKGASPIGNARQYNQMSVDESRVVSRPVSKAQIEDPREFQLGQIRRRFAPREEGEPKVTKFDLQLTPSDPDFPYEIEQLSCTLTVPLDYPESRPSIRVTNKELRRGFQLNVERGFAELAASCPDATLLGLFNRLDKQLETLLSKEMAETMKIVRPGRQEPAVSITSPPTDTQLQAHIPVREKPQIFTDEQKVEAQAKRHADVRQVVARLSRLDGFVQHSDGVTFTIPFQPLKKDALPDTLRKQTTIRLIVPELYNLHVPRVELHDNTSEEARQLEIAFKERVLDQSNVNLLGHINYLSQHAHVMAIRRTQEQPPQPVLASTNNTVPPEKGQHVAVIPLKQEDTGKSHIQVIPRPPEWSEGNNEEEGESDWSDDESLSSDQDSDYESEGPEHAAAPLPSMSSISAERVVSLSFPSLELYSVELLELTTINLTIKCDRCKETMDIPRVRNNTTGNHSGMKEETCKKCAYNLAVGYRMDLIHANSSRAGYLDMDGCTVVDMLPSHFIPTCSECSTPYPAPGVVAVRGDAAMAICRECHKKMTFRIPETKFLHVSMAADRASRAPLRKKVKENLGIVAGQELPQRGRCKHYAKSYRWFRFSCCQHVFPCDKCHDEASNHFQEHANRMICGLCSREQNYSPEQCHFCHSMLIGRRGHGFWEGGKGTRDKTKMSRKDPRKYKRRPGSKPKA